VKFLAVDFDVIERGGINRIVEGLKYGLESAGCVFDYYWASTSGKLRSLSPDAPTMVNDRYYRLPARQISYKRNDSIRNFSRLLRQYDVLLMVQACPHDIKGKQGDMSWTMLYEVAAELGKPIVVIIHDNLWDKYYQWYRQVSDFVKFHLFTCYQSKYDSLARLPGNFVFLPTPLDVRKAGLYPDEKTGTLCWMPQWKKWKGIYQFLDALPHITYPVDLYNSGIEYHNARQDPSGVWKKAVGLNHVNKTKGRGDPTHQYWGSQLPDVIPDIYKSHAASIDLAGSIGERFDGQTSCIMFEAMVYGCVSIVHEKVDQHRWSPLAGQDIAWTVPSDPEGIAERVNEILRKPRTRARIAQRALEFVTEYSDARQLAYMILEFVEADLTKDPEHPATFYDNVCEDPVSVYDFTTYELKPYVSKNLPKKEEPVLVVAEIEEEEVSLATISEPVVNGQVHQQDDTRWIRFITGVARAWVEVFGDY
jgi:glycosyltransferase involved in cell wall biosynthesis